MCLRQSSIPILASHHPSMIKPLKAGSEFNGEAE